MTTRKEPRSMTAVDAMALVAGIALGFSWRPIIGGFPYSVPQAWVLAAVVSAWVYWVAAMGASAVVVARSVRYRRGPRPAEWLAILSTIAGIIAMGRGQPPDLLIDRLPPGVIDRFDTYVAWRWTVAGLATLGIVAGLGLLRLGRPYAPPWARTAVLAFLAFLTICGPFGTFALFGADLFAPSTGFGPGLGPLLAWIACRLLATTPLALLAAVPSIATLGERLAGKRWRWVEWAGLVSTTMIAVSLLPLWRGEVHGSSAGFLAERALVGLWLVGVALLARLLILRAGPTWSGWFGDQVPASGSGPIDASPASTL